MGIKEDWQAGMSYDELHRKYFSPMRSCECDACDDARAREIAEEDEERSMVEEPT